jgi:protein TIF31
LDGLIKESAKSRFRYELKEIVQEGGEYTLLRSICNKVGIQMDSEAACFTNGFKSFEPKDILNIYPIVKHLIPGSALGLKALDHGQDLMAKEDEESQKNGLQILKEAVSIYEQIYSSCHPETGRQVAKVAMQAFNFKDVELAVELQRNALIVAEMTLGLDHSDTIQQYINLGYFEFRQGNVNVGMKLVAYGLQQWELLAKENHPEMAAIYVNRFV